MAVITSGLASLMKAPSSVATANKAASLSRSAPEVFADGQVQIEPALGLDNFARANFFRCVSDPSANRIVLKCGGEFQGVSE